MLPAAKRRKLSPPNDTAESKVHNEFYKQAARWNLEQDYEQRPRKQTKKNKESSRLPIKTAEGKVEKSQLPEIEAEEDEDWLDSRNEESHDQSQSLQPQSSETYTKQSVTDAKEELAKIATSINENPEENAGGFRALGQIATTQNPTIRSLALVTQMSVYKDVIPGYRIRQLSEAEQSEKVSKDVRDMRSFEQALVTSYQTYVKDLAYCAKYGLGTNEEAIRAVRTVAVSCSCSLLVAVPHFNFRGELLKIVVGKLNKKSKNADFTRCCDTIIELFKNDEESTSSLDAVSFLTKMLKACDYQIDEAVLSTFLHLRLLSEFSSKASRDRIDEQNDNPELNGRKRAKVKREFRTKKQRKTLKEQKAVEKDFQEADAIVSHEQRDRMQAETLKLVFVTYFRILKARTPHLMGAVLEGLAKFAHLINQDFFGDLLEALKDLIRDIEASENLEVDDEDGDGEKASESPPRNQQNFRQILLCISTAFALLEGQDIARSAASLNLDLTFFIKHLYKSLHALSMNTNLESSTKAPRLPDPDTHDSKASGISPADSADQASKPSKINLQTSSALLVRALSSSLSPRNTPPLRLAAFTKTLYSCLLQFPEKTSMALMALLDNVVKLHGRKIGSLWRTEERKGDGVFDPWRGDDVEGTNPFASTIWEGELLRLHYSPNVREQARSVERLVGKLGS